MYIFDNLIFLLQFSNMGDMYFSIVSDKLSFLVQRLLQLSPGIEGVEKEDGDNKKKEVTVWRRKVSLNLSAVKWVKMEAFLMLL